MVAKIKEKIMQDRRIGRSSLEAFLEILKEVEAECLKNPVYQYAMVYAKNLVDFGVDVRDKLDSAVAQSMALNQAYIKGVDDERKRIYEAEYGKDINVRSNGWIPVEKAIPEDGQPIIATFTDGSVYQANFKLFLHENPEYAHNHNVIAWMPLPEPYKPEKGE